MVQQIYGHPVMWQGSVPWSEPGFVLYMSLFPFHFHLIEILQLRGAYLKNIFCRWIEATMRKPSAYSIWSELKPRSSYLWFFSLAVCFLGQDPDLDFFDQNFQLIEVMYLLTSGQNIIYLSTSRQNWYLLFALQLLEENPKSCDALLGRGTAYAFLRNLEIAITDFSKVQMPESKFLLLQGSSSLLECIEIFISQGSCCNCCKSIIVTGWKKLRFLENRHHILTDSLCLCTRQLRLIPRLERLGKDVDKHVQPLEQPLRFTCPSPL
jgi:hypothetical protein